MQNYCFVLIFRVIFLFQFRSYFGVLLFLRAQRFALVLLFFQFCRMFKERLKFFKRYGGKVVWFLFCRLVGRWVLVCGFFCVLIFIFSVIGFFGLDILVICNLCKQLIGREFFGSCSLLEVVILEEIVFSRKLEILCYYFDLILFF